MIEWEYKVLFTTFLPDPNDKTALGCTAEMNQLGDIGWEAYHVEGLPDIITGSDNASRAVWFKRPKRDG